MVFQLEKYSPLTLLAAFSGFFFVLLVTFKILDTEPFRGNVEQGGQASPVTNAMTERAHNFCALYIARSQNRQTPGEFKSSKDYLVWDLGFNRYLVKAQPPGIGPAYLCKIIYRGGDSAEAKNWSLQSVDFVTDNDG